MLLFLLLKFICYLIYSFDFKIQVRLKIINKRVEEVQEVISIKTGKISKT